MTMKVLRVISIVLALLLLAACAGPMDAIIGMFDETSVDIVLGEHERVSAREVNLHDVANAQLRDWIEENEAYWRGERPQPEPQSRALRRAFDEWLVAQGASEFSIPSQRVQPLGNNRYIVSRSDHPTFGISEVFLRDESTGEETLLLDSSGDEYFSRPWVMEIIDERFFMFTYWRGNVGVFDLERMLEIPVELPELFLLHDYEGVHYFHRRMHDGMPPERLKVRTLTLADFDLTTATSLQVSEDLLADVPQASTEGQGFDFWGFAELSPDGRYLALEEHTAAVHIFDIQAREFVARVPVEFRTPGMTISYSGHWKDANTLICLNRHVNRSVALEITLP